jgi:hypothetical protein
VLPYILDLIPLWHLVLGWGVCQVWYGYYDVYYMKDARKNKVHA